MTRDLVALLESEPKTGTRRRLPGFASMEQLDAALARARAAQAAAPVAAPSRAPIPPPTEVDVDALWAEAETLPRALPPGASSAPAETDESKAWHLAREGTRIARAEQKRSREAARAPEPAATPTRVGLLRKKEGRESLPGPPGANRLSPSPSTTPRSEDREG